MVAPTLIRIPCGCGRTLKAPAETAGRKVKCKHCDRVLDVPAVGALATPRTRVQLKVVAGEPVGETVEVRSYPFVIGRGRDAGWIARSVDVSNAHCTLDTEDGRVVVVDHDSRNGTHVNGVRVVGRAPLPAGARLTLGATLSLTVEVVEVEDAGSPNAPPVVVTPRAPMALPAPSGLPWGRRLAKKIACTNCWHKVAPEDLFYVARHPDLIGDPVLGTDEYLRFQPTRFTPKGEALDPKGFPTNTLACPRCHLTIPDGLLEVPALFISVIGAPASGKSHLLAAMTWGLRSLLARACLSFTDADTVANGVIHEYEQALFMNPRPDELTEIRKTQRDDPRLHRTVLIDGASIRYPVPLQFSLWPANGHPARSKPTSVGRVLVLYDNAGEDFLPGAEERGSAVTEHLARVHMLLFLFDPTQDPRFRSHMTKCEDPQLLHGARPGAESSVVRQETVLKEAILRIRRLRGITDSDRIRRPLIVIVSKLDAWEALLPEPVGSEPFVEADGSLRVSVDRIDRVSAAVRALLLRLCPDLVTTAEGLTDVVRYIPVSSLGRAPEVVERDGHRFYGVRPRDLSPRWVTAPISYCLANWAPGLLGADGDLPPGREQPDPDTSAEGSAAELPILAASGEFEPDAATAEPSP